ncbi:hypothetical protein [Cellvibrio sp.]
MAPFQRYFTKDLLPPSLRKFVRGHVFLALLITREKTTYANVDTDEALLDSVGLRKYVSKTKKYKKSWYWPLAITFFISLFFSPIFLLSGILLSIGVWLAESNTWKIKTLYTLILKLRSGLFDFATNFPLSINPTLYGLILAITAVTLIEMLLNWDLVCLLKCLVT